MSETYKKAWVRCTEAVYRLRGRDRMARVRAIWAKFGVWAKKRGYE